MYEERRLPIKKVSMEPGELGGPIQEKLLVLFLKIGARFLERLTRKEVALRWAG